MRLTEAFALERGDIVAIVGGGGKTTAMYRLVREAADDGARAIATGTALFTPPPAAYGIRLIVAEAPDDLLSAVDRGLESGRAAVAAGGYGTKGRLLPVGRDVPAQMLALPGVARVIVEADGSRGRAFKAPGEHEPVIPIRTTLVIAVTGMSVLGRALDAEHVHRPERVSELSGVAAGEAISAQMIATVLSHGRGGRRGVPDGCRFVVMLNQVDAGRIDDARTVAGLLRDAGVERVVLAQAREDPPVVEVIR
jgi:probable selenium-dependent hydroxylase accessory protein YqeC